MSKSNSSSESTCGIKRLPTREHVRTATLAYPEGIQTPIESSEFFSIVCLHKNTVQALLLALNPLFFYRKTLKIVHQFHILLQLLGTSPAPLAQPYWKISVFTPL